MNEKKKRISAQDDVTSIVHVNQKENEYTYNYFLYILPPKKRKIEFVWTSFKQASI